MAIMTLVPLPVTLRQLQYLVAIDETRSFRRAAERCRVAQPSLSAQIAELERSLGVRLFERSQRGVLATAAGAELVARARRVLLEADDLVQAAQRFLDPFEGTLRIGVIPTIAPYLLPDVVPTLRATYPALSLLWIEDKTEVLVRKVSNGELDAALLALEADLAELEHELVARDPFVLATPIGHPLGKRSRPVRTAELAGEKVLLLDDGHCFREQALAYCQSADAEELEFRATSLSTLAQMVSSGAGLTLLPSIAVETESRRSPLAIRRFARPAPARTIVLAWRPRTPLGPALRQIAGTLRGGISARR
jgi:LysR family transcriptional regulator, hydrogen peroxide-inducible genes activator